jgi:hypothetical protein
MHVNSFMCIIYIYIYVAKSVCVCVFSWTGQPDHSQSLVRKSQGPKSPKKTVLYNTVYASETSQEELAYCSICAGAAL